MAARVLILSLAALALGACDPTPRGAARDAPARDTGRRGMGPGMMQRMMDGMPQGVPASTLPDPESRGARLLSHYCSQCHGIPSPRRHAAGDWEPVMRRMVARMEHMSRMPMHRLEAPAGDEADAILAYLQAHALRAAEPDELPDGEAAQLFARTCSRCHALPDPAQHAPGEWGEVVARMRGNMRAMDVEGITDEEATVIVDYLQRASRSRR